MTTTRAVVQNAYGDPTHVLSTQDIAKPAPGPDEVLVAVMAASVHPDVWHVLHGIPRLLRLMGSGVMRPRVATPGTDMAGIVEAVGAGVTNFVVGDRVYGETIKGHQWKNGGAYAEYVAVAADSLAVMPDDLSFSEAAAIPTAGYIASLNMAHLVRKGDRVLVNGGAGGVGMLAIQIAKALGAEVTGVDTTSRIGLMDEVGADHSIDYTAVDFTRSDRQYDVIVDIPGNRSFEDLGKVLATNGAYVLIGHEGFSTRRRRLIGSTVPRFMKMEAKRSFGQTDRRKNLDKKRDHRQIVWQLVAEGVLRPKLDGTYFGLDDVAAALTHLESGQATGRIVIRIGEP